nr:histidine kinase [Bacteroidota bacterium]
MVYDHDLKLRFEPVEFPGFLSYLEVRPIGINNSNLLACLYNHCGPKKNFPKLFLVDENGEIVNEHNFPESSKITRSLCIADHDGKTRFNIVGADGHISVFDRDLQLVSEQDLKYSVYTKSSLHTDLNNDGAKEWIFTTSDQGLLITDGDFKNPVILHHHFPLCAKNSPIIMNGKDIPSLFLYYDDEYLTIRYSKNPMAPLRFLIYLGIYLAIWSFILLIQKLQMIRIRNNEKIHNQIVNLQLKSYRNQMDPHFTFNVFNTMAGKIRKESPDSYKAFIEFSNLIRKILLSSDSITRSIEDELSQLKSYLELEKLRFADRVNYVIQVGDEVDQDMHIPKMVLQTYVENAVKHGIRHKPDSGTVSIQIRKQNNAISIEIKDDGVGREKAKELATDSTGFGLKLMDNYFHLFNEYNVVKIKHEIIDLYDEQNNPAGTKVKILIPLNFSYKLKKHGKR